ncbi:alpha/beta fold hydrolase [Cognatishimia sp.]|uniref:alpha/beta fold hydrolase n=1 Tax=Cognatishimia sp. TaxID=2211648 RepID=UPI003518EE9C
MANFQTSDGVTLFYTDDATNAVPVLCLSGLTRNSTDFSYIDGLLPDARLIKMDYRGRGKSDWVADFTTYSVAREAQDALELMDHLGIEKFAILGTSRGGLIAMTLGAMCMDRILGVAMNDIGPELDAQGLAAIMVFLGRAPVWKTYAEAAAARSGVMAGFANVPDSRWREEVEKQHHQTPQGLINTYDPKLRDAVEASSLQAIPDLWPFFTAFAHVPVALIRGANSDLLSTESFARMQRELPDALAVTVADRGHIPFLDEPEALATLRAWIARLA